MKYTIESRPLDGRFDEFDRVIEAGTTFQPIHDKFDVEIFPGGSFPSGHIELYHPHTGEWYQESLPLSKEDAETYLKERLDRKTEDFEYRMVGA